MTRVSLTESYDDRSVISKLNEMDKRVKENASVVTAAEESARASAESAQETADRFAGSVGAVVQNANAQINASKAQVNEAKAEVDATVTTVAQAVQTANNASASAQASAQTVAGYEDRLTAVEDKAQGNSADIQHLEIETRDLYDRDANDVKLDGPQTITGAKTFNVAHDPIIIKAPNIDGNTTPSNNLYSEIDVRDSSGREIGYFIRRHQSNGDANIGMVCKHTRLGLSADISAFVDHDGNTYGIAPTPNDSAPSNAIVTKANVMSTDGKLNNLVHTIGTESIDGIKTFNDYATGKFHGRHVFVTPNINDNTHWFKIAEWEATNSVFVFEIYGSLNNVSLSYTKIMAGHLSNTNTLCAIENKGTNTGVKLNAKMTVVGNKCTLWVKSRAYHRAIINHIGSFGYGEWQTLNITGTDDTTLYDEPTTPSGGSLVNMLEMV